jgi:hypothetical protein
VVSTMIFCSTIVRICGLTTIIFCRGICQIEDSDDDSSRALDSAIDLGDCSSTHWLHVAAYGCQIGKSPDEACPRTLLSLRQDFRSNELEFETVKTDNH